MYAVKTGEFEGPLDLLLDLIEKRKVSINDVSLASITDQYLEYLKKFENFPIEEVALFVAIASTLLLIKSRSLMPSLELTEEEEQSIEELEERLKLYRNFRRLSLHLKNLYAKQMSFAREGFKGVEVGFVEPEGLELEKLFNTLKSIVENLPAKECLPEAEVKKVITLEEKILELTERIKNSLELSFLEFADSKKGGADEKKIEVIISFLAMLELVKQGIIMVKQANLFGSINICQTNNSKI